MNEIKPAIRLYAIAALASMLLAAAAPAQAQFKPRPIGEPTLGEDYLVEGGVDLRFPTADVLITSESLGIPGTNIDFKTDLGLTDQTFPALHLQFRPSKRNKFRFQLIPINFSQSATLTRDVVFNGQRYKIGVPVNSTLDWKAYRFGYEFDFISKDRGFVGFIVEAKYTDVDGDAAAARSSTSSRARRRRFRRSAASPASTSSRTSRSPASSPASRCPTASMKRYDRPLRRLRHLRHGELHATTSACRAATARSIVGYLIKTDTGSFTLKGIYFGVVARY